MEVRRVEPFTLCGTGEINPGVILLRDSSIMDRALQTLDDYKLIATSGQFVIYNGVHKDQPLTVATAGIGGPATAIVLEELSRAGGRVFILVGSAQAIQHKIKIGDIIVPTSAIRVDGTSVRYLPPEFPCIPSIESIPIVSEISRAIAEAAGIDVHIGPVYSTDAYYKEVEESNDRVAYWGRLGVLAFDMETATLFSVATVRRIKSLSILVVESNIVKDLKKLEYEVGSKAEERIFKAEDSKIVAFRIALETLRRILSPIKTPSE